MQKKSIQFSSFPRVALDSFHIIIKLAMICNFLNGFFMGTWITELKKNLNICHLGSLGGRGCYFLVEIRFHGWHLGCSIGYLDTVLVSDVNVLLTYIYILVKV